MKSILKESVTLATLKTIKFLKTANLLQRFGKNLVKKLNKPIFYAQQ